MKDIHELLKEVQAGSREAEEEFFEYLYVRFTSLVTYKIGEEQSHDLAMEACRIVLEKYRDLEATPGVYSWALQVLNNVLRNYFRTSRVRARTMFRDEGHERRREFSREANHDLRITYTDCLEKISKAHPRYSRVLNLIVEGYTIPEISEELGMKIDTLYVVLNRGRTMLKKCLESGEV